MLKILLTILLFLFFQPLIFARDINFEKIDMSSGLSHNSALCLLEDHEGIQKKDEQNINGSLITV